MAKKKSVKKKSVKKKSVKKKSGQGENESSESSAKQLEPRFASMHPGKPDNLMLTSHYQLPTEFVRTVEELEHAIGLPVWLLIQDDKDRSQDNRDTFNMLGQTVASAFFRARYSELKKGQPIALLIDSQGGLATQSYELAMLLRRHCGGFFALIPRHAKSAATLLSLGADAIIMNEHAELGPLDVQMYDPDREDVMSGLDEVQSLERLEAFALGAMDRMAMLLLQRTNKKVKNVLPFVSEFVTNLTKPMFEGIDVVRYTQMSRALKVAEEYGKRLLRQNYGPAADEIARKLVENYPDHGFPIYPDEAAELGLKLQPPPSEIKSALEKIARHLPGLNAVGRIT